MNDGPTHAPPVWPGELTTTPAARQRHGLTDLIGAIAMFAVLAAAVAVFAHPWREDRTAVSGALARYAPAVDGLSLLAEVRDAREQLIRHQSINAGRVTPANVFLQLPTDVRVAVNIGVASTPKAAREGEVDAEAAAAIGLSELERAVVLDQRTTDLRLDGTISRSGAVIVDAAAGRMQASFEFGDGSVIAIAPPILLLPADLGPEAQPWHSAGLFGSLPVTYDGRVAGHGARQTPIGDFDDCVEVDDDLVIGTDRQQTMIHTRATYCAGVGLVERTDETTESGGAPTTEVSRVISTNARSLPASGSIAPATGRTSGGDIGSPDDWTVTRFGRTVPTGISAGGTGTPRFIPSSPGQVLVTDETGDLVAFDAASSVEQWRFQLGGPALGLVGYDEASRTVLVGSSDHRVYALDDRGLFKWAFETSDNVASRPVAAESVVVVGSEDGNVYGLEVDTGRLKWRVETSAAVASSPALANGVVAIANDDGTLLGLDPATGRQTWSVDLPGSSEGPVSTDGTTFFAGSSSVNNLGGVTAVDSTSGAVRWSASILNDVRSEVAVGDTLVFAIDEGGILTALDKRTGDQRWLTRSQYLGPPVAIGDTAAAVHEDGRVEVLDVDGKVTKDFPAVVAHSPVDELPDQDYGLSLGGGAIWMADLSTVVYRLGPPTGLAEPLELSWAQGPNKGSGLPGGPLTVTPAVSGDRVVVVDGLGGISIVDIASGAARRVGDVDVGDEVVRADPVVVGDRVVTAVGSDLVATDLTTGARAWRVTGDSGDVTVAPLAVGRGLVLWVQVGSQPDPVTGLSPGTLRAIDPTTGAERWKVPVTGGFGGSAAVVDDIVVASSPPTGFDAATGSVRWVAADVPGDTFAATTIDAESGSVIVPMLALATDTVTLFSLDARSGRVRWKHALPAGEGPSIKGRSVVSSGTLVVQTSAGPLVGLDAATGLARWRFAPPGPTFGGIEAVNGFVYFVTNRATVSAVDLRTGTARARASDVDVPLSAQGLTFVHPVAVNGKLIVPLATFLIGLEPLR